LHLQIRMIRIFAISCLLLVFGALQAQTTDLLISEYAEGSSNNKYVEIYNGTGADVNLADYRINSAVNGGAWGGSPITLSGTLTSGSTYVIANSSSDPIILASANLTAVGPLTYNGNDAVGLFKFTGTWNLIDVIGVPGVDPGASIGWAVAGVAGGTLNHTLVRKADVCSPTTDWALSAGTTVANSQWTVFPNDTWTNLGSHANSCGGSSNIQFISSNYSVGENIGTVTVTLNISPIIATASSVAIDVFNGPGAVYGTDYTTTPNGSSGSFTINVPANSSSVSFSVAVIDDAIEEVPENITFVISGVGAGLTVGGTSATVFTILDNDGIPTELDYGDIAIVAMNANNGACSGINGEDEVSFVCFKDITNNTTLDLTDNGWEHTNANFWGNSEGIVRIRRTGGTIPAGTVITLRINNSVITALGPDAYWSYNNLNPVGFIGQLNMNVDGDQLYIMQGGVWNPGTAHGTHNATYTGGKVLYGFSTNNNWLSFQGLSSHSGLYPSMTCFSMAPSATSDFNKYTGPTTPTTQRGWLNRIGANTNWSTYANCSAYNSSIPNYPGGVVYSILFGGFREGWWDGNVSTSWYDCRNWEDLKVPIITTDVTIPPATPFSVWLNAPGAICHAIEIEAGAGMLINGTGTLAVQENMRNNGNFAHNNGTVFLEGSETSTISGANGFVYHNLQINKTGGANVYADTTITIKQVATFNSGIITHDTDSYVRFNATAAIPVNVSNTSHVDGRVQRLGTTTFVFPTGNDGIYQPIGISNISSNSTFEARFYNDNGPGLYGYNWEPSIDHVATCSYWTLDRLLGTSDARVLLSWGNDTDCGVDALSDLVVARWNGTEWQNHGQLVTTGNTVAGTVNSLNTISTFSPFALASITGLNPLPVEWLSFDVRPVSESDVQLNWITATEINNDYFVVEHTSNDEDFKQLTTIAGNGNSSTLNFYEWLHKDAPAGDNYYRLKQVDFNGDFEYSPVKTVKIVGQGVQVNAFASGDWLMVNLSEPVQKTQIQIFDLTGRILVNSETSNGNRFEIPIHNLSRGVYVVQVNAAGISYSNKFVR
jgi:hypothetical protein